MSFIVDATEYETEAMADGARLNKAIKENRHRELRELIAKGVSPDSSCQRNDGSLRFAIETAIVYDRRKAFDDLLSIGARITDESLFLAARKETDFYLKRLAERGCDFSAVDSDGRNLIFDSTVNHAARHIPWLVEQGVIVDQRDRKTDAALLFASRKGFANEVEALIKCGADINLRDHRDNPPLCLAILEGRFECIKVLLAHGADINTLPSEFRHRENYTNVTVAILQGNAKRGRYDDRVAGYLASYMDKANLDMAISDIGFEEEAGISF